MVNISVCSDAIVCRCQRAVSILRRRAPYRVLGRYEVELVSTYTLYACGYQRTYEECPSGAPDILLVLWR